GPGASGALSTPTRVQLADLPPVPPMIARQSSVDPLLAMEQKFANRVAEDPRDLSAQLEYQLLRFLKNEQVPKNNDLIGLPGEDQELLAAMCDALSNFRSI